VFAEGFGKDCTSELPHESSYLRVSTSMWKPRIVARAVAAGAILLLAACGGSPTASPSAEAGGEDSGLTETEQIFEEIYALSGQGRRDRLVELATGEDGLNLYTSMTPELAAAVTEGFSDAFDIDVNVYRASSATLVQRILQEQDAGFAGNDVVETNSSELGSLQAEGAMAEYRGERRDMVPEAGQSEAWTATRFNLFVPSWNTELISDPPTSWEDLADPKYDGQLALELDDYDWYMGLYDYWLEQGKSAEEVDQLFADMADGASVVKGHVVMSELMAAGQFGVAASNYTYIVQAARAAGAPVTAEPLVEPVIARPNGAGLMKTAANPATAVLFMDWMLEDGQQIISDFGLTPAIEEGGGLDVELFAIDTERLLDEGTEWSKRYADLLAGVETIE
jgi:iron(III) transport system substrate-binding protein